MRISMWTLSTLLWWCCKLIDCDHVMTSLCCGAFGQDDEEGDDFQPGEDGAAEDGDEGQYR